MGVYKRYHPDIILVCFDIMEPKSLANVTGFWRRELEDVVDLDSVPVSLTIT